MPVGSPRPNAGRPKGARNRKVEEAIAATESSGQTPLEYLLQVMRDAGTERRDRIDAAKAAAPYVHARLSQIEAVVDGNVEIVGKVVWGGLSG